MTDRELLSRYLQAGDKDAFSTLVERHSPMIYGACMRVLRNHHEAEEATQATFVVLMNRHQSVRSMDDMSGWLYRVASNVAKATIRSRVRRARREQEVFESAEPATISEVGEPANDAVLGVLDKCISSLTELQRQAVVLRYLEGHSQEEGARLAGCSVGAFAVRASNGIARLRKMLLRRMPGMEIPALESILERQSAAAIAPAALLPGILKAVATGIATTGAGASTGGAAIAREALQMMFWAKVKAVAAVAAGIVVVGGGAVGVAHFAARGGSSDPAAGDAGYGTVAAGTISNGLVVAKDVKGREWLLENWKQGRGNFPAPESPAEYKEWLDTVARPYPKDLKEREAWYLKKNGENWDGPVFGDRILSPGDWKWETVVGLPDELVAQFMKGFNPKTWGGIYPKTLVYAPGGGEVTDIYASALSGYVHYDPRTKKISFIGSPKEAGDKDGSGDVARIRNYLADENPTVDIVSGRIYWRIMERGSSSMRYVEKLLRYSEKTGGSPKEYLLPALLDYKEFYKSVRSPGGCDLEPVMAGGQRTAPVFVVRTCTKIRKLELPGPHRGKRPLLTPDGRGIWLAAPVLGVERLDFDCTVLYGIDTGTRIGPLRFNGVAPEAAGAVGGFGGICVGLDGRIYTCQHSGDGGGPMRLFSIDPSDGRFTYLYDSAMGDPAPSKRGASQWDGPADASNLTSAPTYHQIQCPRSGAIINGGDQSAGIRRYLDGFVTTQISGHHEPRPGWSGDDVPRCESCNCEPAVAPNGDLYIADASSPRERIWRMYRTDWPAEQPKYGYGEKHMPKARLEELMLEYARNYLANYDENSRF
ncbi:MAG: hypothetical protein C0404_14020 [Verrucomicrobia bacterium]|nr:hypothetical protein [Verrucomicrobiota bacterium]